jgi:hypothetical protein
MLIVACGIVPSPAPANDTPTVVFVGSYEKVASSTGEHCSGYTVDIWKEGNKPFGLFHYHAGLCGDPPCGVLDAVRYDTGTGKLDFRVETGLSKFRFSGKLTPQSLSGSLQESPTGHTSWTDETVDLPRKGTPRDDEFHEQLRTLPEWHARYDSYARCVGVTGYMKRTK